MRREEPLAPMTEPNARSSTLYSPWEKFADTLTGATRHELSVVFREMSELIGAGVRISDAFAVLIPGVQVPQITMALLQAEALVNHGERLSRSFAASPEVFPEIVVQMMGVAETSGKLPEVLEKLAAYFERQYMLYLKLRSALTYPLFIFGLCMAIVIIAPGFMLKGIFTMLEDMGAEIPMSTRALMLLSSLIRNPFAWFAGAGAGYIALRFYSQRMSHRENRLKRDAWLLRLPVIGPCLQHVALQQFATMLGLMYGSGVSIMRALEMAGRSVNNVAFEDAAMRTATQLSLGISLPRALAKTKLFPRAHLHFIEVGVEVGDLADMLTQCAWLSELQINDSIDTALAALEPGVLAFMGIVVGFIALATIGPLLEAMQRMAL